MSNMVAERPNTNYGPQPYRNHDSSLPYVTPFQGGVCFQQNGFMYNTYPDVKIEQFTGYIPRAGKSRSSKHKHHHSSKSHRKRNSPHNHSSSHTSFKQGRISVPLSTPPMSPLRSSTKHTRQFKQHGPRIQEDPAKHWDNTFEMFRNWIDSRIQNLDDQYQDAQYQNDYYTNQYSPPVLSSPSSTYTSPTSTSSVYSSQYY